MESKAPQFRALDNPDTSGTEDSSATSEDKVEHAEQGGGRTPSWREEEDARKGAALAREGEAAFKGPTAASSPHAPPLPLSCPAST
ncbi:hypothetical protein T484DRAFT_1760947 [Baffinella frigidus]|nr:hypothetical protein T484DRAFT_1760947 [Cryptophyta sp. CCMP2293]